MGAMDREAPRSDTHSMVVLWALMAWFVISLPAGVVIGRLCGGACDDEVVGWSADDDRQVRDLLSEGSHRGE